MENQNKKVEKKGERRGRSLQGRGVFCTWGAEYGKPWALGIGERTWGKESTKNFGVGWKWCQMKEKAKEG